MACLYERHRDTSEAKLRQSVKKPFSWRDITRRPNARGGGITQVGERTRETGEANGSFCADRLMGQFSLEPLVLLLASPENLSFFFPFNLSLSSTPQTFIGSINDSPGQGVLIYCRLL
ncbi:hypothetical protein HYQ46_005128 [Verticillium longisporum]|nr:hypothetical protein HYQ46_005128 [Verticillium longisporum]